MASAASGSSKSVTKAILFGVASLSFGALAYFQSKRNKATADPLYGGIECGGTTFKVSLARGSPTNIVKQDTIQTTTPNETLQKVLKFFEGSGIVALGVASFGPVDLDLKSPTYGYITTTPKQAWTNADVLSPFKVLNVPIGFTTDVNAAAMAEIKYGGHGSISSCCYITVGTGIGVGVATHSLPSTGLLHPEGGHILIRRRSDDKYAGNCPRHGGECLEGLANARAISDRLGFGAETDRVNGVADSDPIWDLVSDYYAQLCAQLTLILSPHVIVCGGGVFKRLCLFPLIRKKTVAILNGYIQVKRITDETDQYIVRSRLEHKHATAADAKSAAAPIAGVTGEATNEFSTPGTVGSLEVARLALGGGRKGGKKRHCHSKSTAAAQ